MSERRFHPAIDQSTNLFSTIRSGFGEPDKHYKKSGDATKNDDHRHNLEPNWHAV